MRRRYPIRRRRGRGGLLNTRRRRGRGWVADWVKKQTDKYALKYVPKPLRGIYRAAKDLI